MARGIQLFQKRLSSTTCGRTAWKWTWPLNSNFLFSFNSIIPDLSGGRGNILHVWSHSTGILQIAPLIFLCWPLGMTIIFSNTILCAVSICSSFSRMDNSGGSSSTCNLLHTAWHGTCPFKTFVWQVLQMYWFSSNDLMSVNSSCWVLYVCFFLLDNSFSV